MVIVLAIMASIAWTFTDDIPQGDYTKEQLVRYTASGEVSSEHSLAKAIVDYAKEERIDLLATTDFNSIIGRGITFKVEGLPKSFYLGNHKLMLEQNIPLEESKVVFESLAGSGTDVAIESANIVLMHSDLMDVPLAIDLSHKTIRNIKQNLFWAFAYNTVGIPIAMGVLHIFGGPLLNPVFAAAAMSLSSVSVVLNALRLKGYKMK